ncbi:hypothetical protein E2C01_027510 [Portunus trituberculatus]|uniref:Uncharacterized protein n=1 Tax=Portunus trituberculatus TaxID=210409 RepID=A0A5B7EIB0_PORTR|nr:hypothetical protein [Portunus trituberculatus]
MVQFEDRSHFRSSECGTPIQQHHHQGRDTTERAGTSVSSCGFVTLAGSQVLFNQDWTFSKHRLFTFFNIIASHRGNEAVTQDHDEQRVRSSRASEIISYCVI